MHATIPVLALATLAALAPGVARADAARDALTEVARCADIAEAAARLQCFDAAVARAKAALAAPAPVAAPAPKQESLLEKFGLSRPSPPPKTPAEFGKPPPPEPELSEMTATVVDFARTPRGQALFVLDNGQVWRQLDADTTSIANPAPGKPMRVKIEKGFLNSFNLTVDGRNPLIKVFRLK